MVSTKKKRNPRLVENDLSGKGDLLYTPQSFWAAESAMMLSIHLRRGLLPNVI